MDNFDKKFLIITTSFLILFVCFQQFLVLRTPKKEDVLIEKLNNLEKKLDSISNKKDSIRLVIEKQDVKLEENEKQYVETTNNILIQSDSANRAFIDNYIGQYWKSRN